MYSLIQICGTAAREFAEHRQAFLRILLIPILIWVGHDVWMETSLAYDPSHDPNEAKISFLTALSLPLTFLLMTVFAVGTHRILLLGPEAATGFSAVFLKLRTLRFLGYSILLTILMIIPLSLATIIGAAMIVGGGSHLIWITTVIAGLLVGTYLFSRFAFVFPSIATDQPATLADAWQMSSQCQLQAFLIVIVLPMALGIPNSFLYGISLPITLFASTLGAILALYAIACFSILYRQVVAQAQENASE